MNLFDSHFHIDPAEKPSEFIDKCAAAGVVKTLACGGSLEDSKAAAEFADAVPFCLFAAGVHPNEAAAFNGAFNEFMPFAEKPKFAAIGEIGLDFHYGADSKLKQVEVFEKFLEIALELKRPALIHCRDGEGRYDAYETMHAILKPFSAAGGRFELHCFCGNVAWAEKFAELGAYFGIGGMLTFKKAQNIRDVAAMLPLDKILLETDSPYLAPVPHRGKPNHPSLLPHIAKAFAELRGISAEDAAKTTFDNAERLLRHG